MTNEGKKQFLRQYQAARRKESLILEEIEQLRSRKTSPVGLGDGMPHGSGLSDLSEYAARLDDLLRELEAEREKQLQAYQQIREQIMKVPNQIEQDVLARRYLLGQSWEKISVEINYDYRYVLKIHGKALLHFEIA